MKIKTSKTIILVCGGKETKSGIKTRVQLLEEAEVKYCKNLVIWKVKLQDI